MILFRAAIALAAFLVALGGYRLWKRPPRLERRSLFEEGIRGPAIVQFTTRYCAPCKVIRPHLVDAAREASVEYAQIDVGERPEVANRFGIRTVPTIVVTGRGGEILGVWTKLPSNGEIAETARRAVAEAA